MKRKINSKLKLTIPSEKGQYILYIDASDIGISQVLNRIQNEKEVPILCTSKKLSPAHRKYAVVEKDCLAIVWGGNRLQKYLWRKHFIIRSDHKTLQLSLHTQTSMPRARKMGSS